jgi:uncharacterized cupredoxin-like copper-binding protein
MTAYYVLGIAMVVGAVVLAAIGLTREGFPPSKRVARGILAGTFVLVLAGAVVLVSTTHKEHPKAEAAEKAAEQAAEESGGAAGGPEGAVQGEGGGKTVRAVEKEFSIKLDKGNSLQAGSYRFQVVNEGKIEHNLEIEGNGVEKKTPLIAPGKEAALQAELKPAKYRFYCTVPGHAQSGMDVDVNVR